MCNSHLGLYTNLDPQKSRFRIALGASPMGMSACHLQLATSSPFSKPKCQKNTATPSVSLIPQSWFSNRPLHTQFLITEWLTNDDSERRARIQREGVAHQVQGKLTPCNPAQIRTFAAPNWVLLVAHFRNQHISDRASHPND